MTLKSSFYGILSVCLVGLLVGCAATTASLRLTSEERDYIEKAKVFPLEFVIPKAEANEAWGRAQTFISKHSGMRLQTATDFVLETHNPISGAYGYHVTKTPMGEEVQITVECIGGSIISKADRELNAHILAYYIKTGEPPSPRIIMQ